jgi:hypothetical protein
VIVNNTTINRVSYNGGNRGVMARPSRHELEYEREPHRAALDMQMHHEHEASQNRRLFASENHGRPEIAATARPGEFRGHVVGAREAGAPYHAPAVSPREARGPSPRDNGRGNEGFHKFGEPEHRGNGNERAERDRGDSNWNAARPGNRSNEREFPNRNDGDRKFSQPGNGNRPSQNSNDNWRGNRPEGNSPRPVSRPEPVSSSRGPEQGRNQNMRSAPPKQNAPKSDSHPHENQGHGGEKHHER